MQTEPLSIAQALEHAARFHGTVEIVTRRPENGSIHRYTYAEALRRTKQLANALQSLNVQLGDRVATMAWNTNRHLEAWYAISGQGAICHTVNPRLFEEQIVYILNHAEDSVLMLDVDFLMLLEKLWPQLSSIKHVIVMTDREHLPQTNLPNVHCYEELIANESEEFTWPTLEENTPSSLCYTSGTTGDPKGVLYTHRSNLLHSYAINAGEANGIAGSDVVLMTVPMFHANSWGLAFSCPMAGSKLVLPGSQLDGESVHFLIETERVTFSAAVPTLWKILFDHLEEHGGRLDSLRQVLIGGSTVPKSMIETFENRYSVQVVHAWGMTEANPTGTMCRLTNELNSLPPDEQQKIRVKQGKPVFGVNLKIVDDEGKELPHDGVTMGRLMIKGLWVMQRYYKAECDAVDPQGWLDTGDIATIDPYGYMQITDRAKDLIKSGGEWISSVELENLATEHPDVAMAAVIGIHHETWQERPLLIVQPVAKTNPSGKQILNFMTGKVAKWWLPDRVEIVTEIPLTAAGKISKKTLRDRYSEIADFT